MTKFNTYLYFMRLYYPNHKIGAKETKLVFGLRIIVALGKNSVWKFCWKKILATYELAFSLDSAIITKNPVIYYPFPVSYVFLLLRVGYNYIIHA